MGKRAPAVPCQVNMQIPAGLLASSIVVVTRAGVPPIGAGPGDKIFTLTRKSMTEDLEINEEAVGSAMLEVFGQDAARSDGQDTQH